MVVGRNNGVVGLTGFSDKKMSGLLFGPQKVVLIKGWSYGGVPLYLKLVNYDSRQIKIPVNVRFPVY